MNHHPPSWISRLLERFLDPYLFKGIYGDLLEEYHEVYTAKGPRRANWSFFVAALGFIRYHSLLQIRKKHPSLHTMDIFANYLKTTWRNFLISKEHTFVSLFGLAISFTAAAAIFQYTSFERSYDTFHSDGNILYRVTHDFKNSSRTTTHATTFLAAKDAFAAEIPGIQATTHLINNNGIIKKGNESFLESNILAVTPEFFEMFDYEVISGNPQDISDPNTILLSESKARKYFGNASALGETLEIQNVFGQIWKARVVAIFKDFPTNSHLQAELLIPMKRLMQIADSGLVFGPNIDAQKMKWRWLGFHTYVLLSPGADIEAVTEKANEIVSENRAEVNKRLNQHHSVWMQPISTIHTTPNIEASLSPSSDPRLISMFDMIAVFILLIAWINYINMSTARSVLRGKEVGIRKILGAYRAQLRFQFIFEAFLLNFIAILSAIAMLALVSDRLEQLVGIEFMTDILTQNTLPYFILMVIVGSLASGLYPALILSNYKPIEVVKGKFQYSSSGVRLRRLLVGFQLIFTIFLTSGVMIIQGQMNFMIGHSLGINVEQTLIMDGPSDQTLGPAYEAKMDVMLNQLRSINGVELVATSSMVPGIQNGWRASTETRENEQAGIFVHRAIVDEHFANLYDIQFLEGRNFDQAYGSDNASAIINANAMENLGLGNPENALGKYLHFTGNESFKIVGVMSDFYQRGVQFAHEPIMFQLDTASTGNYISLRYVTDQPDVLLQKIEDVFRTNFPESHYRSRFVNDLFQAQYDKERQFQSLFISFSVVALIVACLGLAGLAAHLLHQKNREVSIRKVLGARPIGLFVMLNKEYLIICFLAFLITVPLVTYAMQQWLDQYANRIELHFWLYLIPLLLVIGLIVMTTLRFTLSLINANPATVLKEQG